MAQNDFKIGDVVILKSGGPEMTIHGRVEYGMGVTSDTDWYCVWFDGKKKLEGNFHQDTLEPYTDED